MRRTRTRIPCSRCKLGTGGTGKVEDVPTVARSLIRTLARRLFRRHHQICRLAEEHIIHLLLFMSEDIHQQEDAAKARVDVE